MKILLLNPPYFKKFSRPQRSPAVTKSGTIYFPMWLAYCAGVLEEAGYGVTFTDAPAGGLDLEDILRHGERLRPELIVIDTSTPSIENDIRVGEELKRKLPQSFIVLVGTHVSALPEETLLKNDSIDAVARREYEMTIRELASLLEELPLPPQRRDDLRKVAGLSFRSNGKVIHNPDRPYMKNLDDLPWVSKTYKRHLRIQDYFNPNALYPMVTLITSRGCPFRCSFCVYPQTLTGREYRFRSIEDIIGEIEFVVREFPEAKSIFFEDDTLTANKKRCLRFSEAIIEKGINIPWTANSRVDLDLETMLRMREAGCRELCVGFESGNQHILDSMRKGIQLERMFQFMKDARQAGILIHGCFILGFPGETEENIQETIRLAMKLNPDTVQFYPVMVYPGTEAFEEYRQRGWLTASSYGEWLTSGGLHNCVVRNEYLSSADLVRLCDMARRRYYLRPGYLVYKLYQMLEKPSEIRRTTKAARTFLKHLIVGSRG
ncbi:MAG: radical SAM protein [Syntrophales bacterium]|nr:radical SAM protein [Syntrophales bacterium]